MLKECKRELISSYWCFNKHHHHHHHYHHHHSYSLILNSKSNKLLLSMTFRTLKLRFNQMTTMPNEYYAFASSVILQTICARILRKKNNHIEWKECELHSDFFQFRSYFEQNDVYSKNSSTSRWLLFFAFILFRFLLLFISFLFVFVIAYIFFSHMANNRYSIYFWKKIKW